MSWDLFLATAGPLAGALIGGTLTSREARRAFLRGQSMAEVARRREHFAAYQKALWAYAARVKIARDLVAAGPRGTEGLPPAEVYDMALTKQCQEECRNAIADLRLFASSETQDAAWAAYEALSQSFNALVGAADRPKSDQAFQDYEEAFARCATAINGELEQINYMLYAYQTPCWRAVLRKIGRKPLPFVTDLSGDPGTPLVDPRGETPTPIR